MPKCRKCEKEVSFSVYDILTGKCPDCVEQDRYVPPPPPPPPAPVLPCVTTETLPGYITKAAYGVVGGATVLGMNILKDIGADIRNITGGRAKGYETELRKGRFEALREMAEEAAALGANAVVAVTVRQEAVGDRMMMVSASGTAVIVEEEQAPRVINRPSRESGNRSVTGHEL